MRLPLAVFILALATFALTVPSAAVGATSNCGSIPAKSIKKIRATKIDCKTARKVASSVQRTGTAAGYKCRHRGLSPAAVTCVRGARKVTFTLTGSYEFPPGAPPVANPMG